MGEKKHVKADAPRIRMAIEAIAVARLRIEPLLYKEVLDFSPGQRHELTTELLKLNASLEKLKTAL